MNWLNLLILLLLIAGHTELVVMAVNRMHSLRISCRTLGRWHRVLDVLLVSFPVLLIWYVGIRGPQLLSGGNWQNLPAGWTIYLTLCALGTTALVGSIVRWGLRRHPEQQLSNHSWTIDIEERLGYRPVESGPYRYLTRLPHNEIFQVEVSEKIYRLPRLPREWDGLSILHLSDLHFIGTIQKPFFEQIVELSAEMEADLIVFTGDLLDKQRLVDWLPDTLARLHAPLGQYFILGNHDWFLEPEPIRQAMIEIGWTNVAGKTESIQHKGHCLTIGGTERPWMGEHPDFSDSPTDAFRLLLSHTPDHFKWARNQNVDLMLSGHNHGGQVVLPMIGPVFSPSRFGVRHAGGVFWQDPTLLYVSRGISARHPLRWNCPPELTKLVLQCADDE